MDKKTETELSKPGDLEEMFVLRVLYKKGGGIFVETTSGWQDKGIPIDLLRRILKRAWKRIPLELTHEASRIKEAEARKNEPYQEHSLGPATRRPSGESAMSNFTFEDLIEARRRSENPMPEELQEDLRRLKEDLRTTEPCPWCGQPVTWDPENYFAEKRDHEKICPQVREWERCKE